MKYRISKSDRNLTGNVNLVGSKSESNRALIIQQLTSGLTISNLSQAQDTVVLQHLLKEMPGVLDARAAGTTFRFLTALLAITGGDRVITGSARMKERPVGILVDALRQLGADIDYEEKPGYPPLRIVGKPLPGGTVSMRGDVSSQYISALLLIAPALKSGLHIKFTTEPVSRPYLEMTLALMRRFRAEVVADEQEIVVQPIPYQGGSIHIESDWSAASYWYEMAAFSDEVDLTLHGLKKESLQGDSCIAQIYEQFGVYTEFTDSGVRLTKGRDFQPSTFNLHLNCEAIPDLAQTLACTCAGLGLNARLSGLKTLRIKETDRIMALQNELARFGVESNSEGDEVLNIFPAQKLTVPTGPVQTYHDHRMAMAFAPLAMVAGPLTISDPGVVDKSYPSYWDELRATGFQLEPL